MSLRDLCKKLARGEAVVGGVLSGTSADGIDVVLAQFSGDIALDPGSGERPADALGDPVALAFETLPYPRGVAERLRGILDGEPLDLRGTALLDRDLGRAFGQAAEQVARAHGLVPDLLGSHGQTVYHHDGREVSGPATLQLGDGDFVAEEVGCAVVSDFRQRDVAAGGEGAPISALADDLLFRRAPRPAAILNLGGFANLTVLLPGERVLSFDTGPAGSLLDGLARRVLGEPMDRGGARAFRGRSHEVLVSELLKDEFFTRPPPRSTGRDTFGKNWTDDVLRRAEALGVLRDAAQCDDLFATAVEFVAAHIALSVERFAGPKPRTLLVCGGGLHNTALAKAIERRTGLGIASTAEYGVDPDAREALVFAVLAARCVLEMPVTSRSATGARPGRVLGKISPAPGTDSADNGVGWRT